MARKRLTREEARQGTREAILQAAKRLFSERGYRGASLDEIAESAGYSKGAVYSNWSSKEALFLELMDLERRTEQGSEPDIDLTPTTWALATLEFFIEAVHSPDARAALADRYRKARSEAGRSIAAGRPDPTWATWEELAAVAMAIGSGLIIQNTIETNAVDPSILGRVMQRLIET